MLKKVLLRTFSSNALNEPASPSSSPGSSPRSPLNTSGGSPNSSPRGQNSDGSNGIPAASPPSSPAGSPRYNRLRESSNPGELAHAEYDDLLKLTLKKRTLAESGDVREDFDKPAAQTVNPLFSLFQASFNRKGDVIYGMSQPRAKYIKETLGQEAMALGDGALTADARNRWIIPANETDAKAEMPQNVAAYHAFLLAHEKPKYKDLASREIVFNARRIKKIERSCKALIEATARQGNTVHFVLDNDSNYPWDMEALVKKDPQKKASTLISSKELRFAYKNRDKKMADGSRLIDHIQFWKDGKKIDAPWVSNPDLWNEKNFNSLKPPKKTG